MILTYSCDENQIRDVYEKDLKKFFTNEIILPCIECENQKWYNEKTIVLFIAESPPWSIKEGKEIEKGDCKKEDYVYFYNRNCTIDSKGLANFIFKKLEITTGNRESKLGQFCEKQFFLTDTIKCIVKKERGKKIPKTLIKYSAKKILMHEIDAINPTKCIVVLGKTALYAIKEISKITNENCEQKCLKNIKKANKCLENIKKYTDLTVSMQKELCKKYGILVMPFLNNTNYSETDKKKQHCKKLIDQGFLILNAKYPIQK